MNLQIKEKIDYCLGNVLLFLFKPIGYIIKIFTSNKDLELKGSISFIKMLGGGTLVLLYPIFLSIKKTKPDIKLILITTPSVKVFAEVLGVFDEIIIIDDNNLLFMILSFVKNLIKILKTKIVVNLEIYSKLSSVLSFITLARFRIGFYYDNYFLLKGIFTHLIYFNRYASFYRSYVQILKLLDIDLIDDNTCKDEFYSKLNIKRDDNKKRISIGHACSDLSKERMLNVKQWKQVFAKNLDPSQEVDVFILGAEKDRQFGDKIIEELKLDFNNITLYNYCGKLSLKESVEKISMSNEFWGIDSGLLHFARLLGVKTVSFWGPVNPSLQLSSISYLQEEINYTNLICSPCIHFTKKPPCNGNNVCISSMFENEKISDPLWVIKN